MKLAALVIIVGFCGAWLSLRYPIAVTGYITTTDGKDLPAKLTWNGTDESYTVTTSSGTQAFILDNDGALWDGATITKTNFTPELDTLSTTLGTWCPISPDYGETSNVQRATAYFCTGLVAGFLWDMFFWPVFGLMRAAAKVAE